MIPGYVLEPATTGAEWDAFVEASPHGTVYASSAFLDHLDKPAQLFYCLDFGNRKAAVVLQVDETGAPRAGDSQLIYSGVMCAGAHVKRNPSDAFGILEYFRATEFVVTELAKRYPAFAMQLAPSFVDIRPFLWYNYDTDGPRFTVDVRYTSYLDISDCAAEDSRAFEQLRRDRRRDVRNAQRHGIMTTEEFDPELCVELHRRTMQRQQLDVSAAAASEMIALMRALREQDRGRMFVARAADGTPASALFFGLDSKRAYAMFGGTDPAARSLPTFVAVLWDGCRALSNAGVRELDLEGVNSPRRGWFKLSFGGSILPYYAVSLNQRGAPSHG